MVKGDYFTGLTSAGIIRCLEVHGPCLRLDAALSDPPPPRAPGTIGRPRLQGQRRPTLEAVWADERTPGTPLLVAPWEGEGPREGESATATAVWSHTGEPPVAIRWVVIRDPHEHCKPQALLSTNLAHTPEQMLTWFVRRWTLEVTVEEARAHLGMERSAKGMIVRWRARPQRCGASTRSSR